MNEPRSPLSALMRGTGVVGILTLFSRALGFVRDLLFALLFGAGSAADAFFVAFRVPNLMRSLVAEGALTSAFVPVFTDELAHSKEHAQLALRKAATFILALTVLITVLGVLYSPTIVSFLAPGFRSDTVAISAGLLQIMMPIVIALSFVAIINGALNTQEIFGAAAVAQITMNIVVILGIASTFFIDSGERIFVISYWVLFGGLAQVLVQLPGLKKAGFSILPILSLFSDTTKKIALLLVPAIVAAAVYQISIILNTILASYLGSGAVSWLFYADRIAQLPIGIFTIALSSVLLPLLARSASSKKQGEYVAQTIDALRYVSFVMIPISFVLFFSAPFLIKLLFERGAFTPQASAMTSNVLMGYAVGLWSISCQSILSRSFIAKKDPLTPAILSLLSLAVGLHVSLLTMGTIETSNPTSFTEGIISYQEFLLTFLPASNFSATGLALGSSATSLVALVLFLLIFLKRESDVPIDTFLRSTLKALLSSLPIAALALLKPHPVLFLFFAPFIYVFFSFLTKSQESNDIFVALNKFRNRSRPFF